MKKKNKYPKYPDINPIPVSSDEEALAVVQEVMAPTELIEPMWFNTETVIDTLRYAVPGISRGIAPFIHKNGMVNTVDGYIEAYRDPAGAAIIPGLAFTVKDEDGKTYVKDSTAAVINTMNNGFRFVSVNPKNGMIMDLGPMDAPMIVGNSMAPSALLVPLNNGRAISDAGAVANAFLDEYKELAKSMLADEIKECEGKCSCGDNCSCHDDDDEDDNTIKVRFI